MGNEASASTANCFRGLIRAGIEYVDVVGISQNKLRMKLPSSGFERMIFGVHRRNRGKTTCADWELKVRLGTLTLRGVVQEQNAAVPRPRQRCNSVHPLHFVGSVAHQQSARVTCERQRGQHSPLPPFFEGIAQLAERVLHMHQVEGAIPSALTISVPVV